MTSDPLSGIACTAHAVLNAHEQTLYNLCEEYFVSIQRRSNRHCVLSQLRLVDAIEVAAPKPYIGKVQFNALSFDILVTDSAANPIFVFEADGPTHNEEPQLSRDAVKNAIAKKAGIHVFRLKVKGMLPPLEVIRAEACTQDFERDLEYPTMATNVCYSRANFPEIDRVLELSDIELLVIRTGWNFPPGWEFVTDYELR